MLDIEKIKEEFGYEGKPKQWQLGFDALLKHLDDYVKKIRKTNIEPYFDGGSNAGEINDIRY